MSWAEIFLKNRVEAESLDGEVLYLDKLISIKIGVLFQSVIRCVYVHFRHPRSRCRDLFLDIAYFPLQACFRSLIIGCTIHDSPYKSILVHSLVIYFWIEGDGKYTYLSETSVEQTDAPQNWVYFPFVIVNWYSDERNLDLHDITHLEYLWSCWAESAICISTIAIFLICRLHGFSIAVTGLLEVIYFVLLRVDVGRPCNLR